MQAANFGDEEDFEAFKKPKRKKYDPRAAIKNSKNSKSFSVSNNLSVLESKQHVRDKSQLSMISAQPDEDENPVEPKEFAQPDDKQSKVAPKPFLKRKT